MSQLNAEHRLFINGAPVNAEGGATCDVINPATEEVVGGVAAASTADGDHASSAARRCFGESDWSLHTARRLRALTQLRRENGVEGFEEYLETKTIAVPTDFPRLVG